MPDIEDKILFNDPKADGLDSDSDLQMMPSGHSPVDRERGQYGRENCLTGYKNLGSLRNLMGTEEVNVIFPLGDNTIIGGTQDWENDGIIFFNYNSNGNHGIYRYNLSSKDITIILYQPSGVPTATFLVDLNFSLEHKIFRNAGVLGGILFWIVRNNQPCMLDIERAINYTAGTGTPAYSKITYSELYVNKKPPIDISIETTSDATYDQNHLRGKRLQFCYKYVYLNNQKSVISPISKLSLPLITEENSYGGFSIFAIENNHNNKIELTIDTGEVTVKRIEMFVREGNGGAWGRFDILEKYDSEGNIVIASDVDNYVYDFYNNKAVTIVDQSDMARPYDYVPDIAGSMEIIKDNTLLYADITEGSENVTTDIDISYRLEEAELGADGDPLAELLNPGHLEHFGVAEWKIDIGIGTIDYGNYQMSFEWDGNYYYADIISDNASEIATVFYNELVAIFGTSNVYKTATNIIYVKATVSGVVISQMEVSNYGMADKNKSWATGFNHRFGLVYTYNGRKIGYVNAIDELYIKTQIEEKANGGGSGVYDPNYRRIVDLDINHLPPSSATHYQIVYAYGAEYSFMLYMSINDVISTGGQTRVDVLTSITDMVSNNNADISYVWEEGDRIEFISEKYSTGAGGSKYTVIDSSDNKLDFEIIKKDGNYLYVKHFNHTIYNIDQYSIVKIYRPVKKLDVGDNDELFYYEIGEKYEIDGGYHKGDTQNQTAGQPAKISLDSGDIYTKLRFIGSTSDLMFPVEATQFSDWRDSSSYDKGRINVVNKDSRRERIKGMMRFGNKFIEGTDTNNANKFEYGDYINLLEKHGAITVLSESGDTLVVIQENKVSSIYLSRTALKEATINNQDIVATSTSLLGTINTSKEKFGCRNPESFQRDGSHYYFWDYDNAVVVRGAMNGLFAISKYYMNNYFNSYKQYVENQKETSTTYEDNVYSFWDNKKGWYGISFTSKSIIGGDTIYNTETLVFEEDSNRWKTFLSFQKEMTGASISGNKSPEFYLNKGNTLLAFMDGVANRMFVSSNMNKFFGEYFPHRIAVKASGYNDTVREDNIFVALDKEKIFLSLLIRSNINSWEVENDGVYVPPSDQYPNGMKSRIKNAKFISNEGVLLASFGKDRLTANSKSDGWNIVNGRDIRGGVVEVTFTNNRTTLVDLKEIKIHSILSYIGEK